MNGRGRRILVCGEPKCGVRRTAPRSCADPPQAASAAIRRALLTLIVKARANRVLSSTKRSFALTAARTLTVHCGRRNPGSMRRELCAAAPSFQRSKEQWPCQCIADLVHEGCAGPERYARSIEFETGVLRGAAAVRAGNARGFHSPPAHAADRQARRG